jgi:hypothetical protein
VDLDERRPHGKDRVAQRETGVGERRRVDEGAIRPPAQPLHRIHQRALVVGLKPLQVRALRPCRVAHQALDLGERGATVDFRLPLPQQVQVGAVEHRDQHSALQVLKPGVELVEVVVLGVRGPGTALGRSRAGSAEEIVE